MQKEEKSIRQDSGMTPQIPPPSFCRLPLLDFVSDLYSGASLEKVYILAEQHIVSSTFELVKALLKKGLKTQNFSLIGKCYSTNPYVYAEMVQSGLDVSSNSLSFNSTSDFDSQYINAVQTFYAERATKLHSNEIEKIIVLSDGGALNEALLKDHTQDFKKFIGIEQTTSGYEKLKNLNLTIPLINVARSQAKLNHESPFIARLTIERLMHKIFCLKLKPRNILIIGNGFVGNQISLILKEHYPVETFDLHPSRSSVSVEDFELAISNADLIIGATGFTSIPHKQHKLFKKNVILASASSSDREFDAVHIRRNYKNVLTDCHQDLLINGIYLVNCGFPVIFDAHFDVIDTAEFQLTRSLLFSAVMQAATNKKALQSGFVSLNREEELAIIQKFAQIKN